VKAIRRQTPEDTGFSLSEGAWKQPSDLEAYRHTSTLSSRSVTRLCNVLHPWPFCPGRKRTGSPSGRRLSGRPQTSSWIRRAGGPGEGGGRTDGRTLANSMERYPQLFAESVRTFGSEAIHKAILSQINQRAYQWQTPVEMTAQSLFFNEAVLTAPIVRRLITWWILLLNYESHEIYKTVVSYKTLFQQLNSKKFEVKVKVKQSHYRPG